MLNSDSLECGDLSPLWSVATCRDDDSHESILGLRRQGAEGQSGDRSPHSKSDTRHRFLQRAPARQLFCGVMYFLITGVKAASARAANINEAEVTMKSVGI